MVDDFGDRVTKHTIKSDKALLRLSSEVVREYSQVLDRYIAFYKEAIMRAQFGGNTAQRLAVANQISAELLAFLEQSGAEDLYRIFSEQHAEVARLARDYFRVFGQDLRITQTLELSGTSRTVIRELLQFNLDELGYTVDRQLVQPLRRQLISGVLAEQDANTIRQTLISTTENLRPDQIEGVIDDIYSQFYRTVQERQAEDLGGFDVVFFNGPMDDRRSAQCEFMTEFDDYGAAGVFLKKDFTQQNINLLLRRDNIRAGGKKSKIVQLTGDPKIQGGHFNCRHGVNYVSRSMAEELMGASFGKD